MRVLQICKKIPIPAKDGEALAILNLTELLAQKNATITLLAMSTPKHKGVNSKLPSPINQSVVYQQHFVNTNFNLTSFFAALFKKESYPIQRFYCKKFESLIIKQLKTKQYDIVQLEGLYLTPYIASIKKHSTAKIVLRAHNVEHELWYKLAKNSNNYFKRILYKRNAKELKKAEQNSFSILDAVVSISTSDEAYFKHHQKAPVYNLPFGININNYNIKNQPFNNTIAFIGSLDWLPNLEGLHWFLNQVFPLVLNVLPNVKFYIAGRNLKDAEQFKQHNSTQIVGEVDDAKAFIAAHSVFVVPLLSGSGMRIKIIEAMALKRAVVSTSLGAAGINYTKQKNIDIADEAMEFATAIIKLLQNKKAITAMGENAHKLVVEQYNNDILGHQLIQFYNRLIR